MSDAMVKVRALLKAQSALTRIELRAKERQAVFAAVALVFALLALGMLNLGAYLGLSAVVGAVWSAVLLGVADAALAGMLVKAAGSVSTGQEGATAKELRDMVLDSLHGDAERLKENFEGIQYDLGRARSALSSVTSGAAGIVPGISSVVGLLTSVLKKKK